MPMKTIYKILIIFLAITGASTLLYNFTEFQFGNIDYFDKHGWIFLIALAFFPRVALFFAAITQNIAIGGLLWWVGYFIAPRFLVALLATASYWHTNQILVIIAWLVALGGESSEKIMIFNKAKKAPKRYASGFSGKTFETTFSTDGQEFHPHNYSTRSSSSNASSSSQMKDGVIEVEYKVKDE